MFEQLRTTFGKMSAVGAEYEKAAMQRDDVTPHRASVHRGQSSSSLAWPTRPANLARASLPSGRTVSSVRAVDLTDQCACRTPQVQRSFMTDKAAYLNGLHKHVLGEDSTDASVASKIFRKGAYVADTFNKMTNMRGVL